MKRNASLKRTTPLKAKTTLKATTKKRPKDKWAKLRDKADDEFSWYIRVRDSVRKDNEWIGTCISCSKSGVVAWLEDGKKLRFTRGWDAGHFVSRGHFGLRWDEENVNLQCSMNCNKMRSGNLEKYKPALDLKYGAGTWRKLEDFAQANPITRPTIADLEEVVHDSKVQREFLINNA